MEWENKRVIVDPSVEPTITNDKLIRRFKNEPSERKMIFSLLGYDSMGLEDYKIKPCLEYLANSGDDKIRRFIVFAETYFLLVGLEDIEKELKIEYAKGMFNEIYDEIQKNNGQLKKQLS